MVVPAAQPPLHRSAVLLAAPLDHPVVSHRPVPAGAHLHRRARFIASLRVNEVLSWSRGTNNRRRREFVHWLLDGNIPQWLEVGSAIGVHAVQHSLVVRN